MLRPPGMRKQRATSPQHRCRLVHAACCCNPGCLHVLHQLLQCTHARAQIGAHVRALGVLVGLRRRVQEGVQLAGHLPCQRYSVAAEARSSARGR
eukprot:1156752-Pelagomonas_calceolata.AAC.6